VHHLQEARRRLPLNRAVLVTGCSTGIGRATAERLAAKGWTVYASARRLESIKDLGDRGCRLLQLDVTDEESMRRAVEAVDGPVGVLVNNAGYALEGPVETAPMDEVRRQFETNVFGLVRMCQLVLPGMRASGWGRIVNMSSMGGRLTLPGGGYYHASKYAVEAISDALRFEVRNFGVHVIVIEPGPIRSSFGDTAVSSVESIDGPYAAFNAALAQRIADAYQGKMARFAAPPEAVARVVDRAIRVRRPRTRYLVTVAARAMVGMRRALPDRAFDAFVSTQFPRPGR
jgi:NAD(P)-dependent dehydrogenase (short-subunit alcohol dehydrogenase family)